MSEVALPQIPAAAEPQAKPKRARRKKSPFQRFMTRLLLAALPIALLGGAYFLARAGIIPVEPLAKKHPIARKVLKAMNLPPAKHKPSAKTAAHTPEPVADAVPAYVPPPAAAPPVIVEPKSAPKDNAARVARVFMTMETSKVVPILEKMSDAEAAPILARMRDDFAGEILAALPPQRAVVLTRFLRRPKG